MLIRVYISESTHGNIEPLFEHKRACCPPTYVYPVVFLNLQSISGTCDALHDSQKVNSNKSSVQK